MLGSYVHLIDAENIGSTEFVRWVTENNRLFLIIDDRSFRCLMKMGRPECYIPSVDTLSHDVKRVFVRVRGHIAKALQVRHVILICQLKYLPGTIGI